MITKIVRLLTDDVLWNFVQRLLQVLDEIIRILDTNAIKREDSHFNWICCEELIEFCDKITKYQTVPYSNESVGYTTAQPVF